MLPEARAGNEPSSRSASAGRNSSAGIRQGEIFGFRALLDRPDSGEGSGPEAEPGSRTVSSRSSTTPTMPVKPAGSPTPLTPPTPPTPARPPMSAAPVPFRPAVPPVIAEAIGTAGAGEEPETAGEPS
ncbi:hypothetical protein GCM10017559_59860 [Streptosporangium longisporum]|uniref:Uncharacterized protein n=1 Tax=Streptosporangium longisporum TaxID=46187 RepID=A0ABP6KX55_9ACTN